MHPFIELLGSVSQPAHPHPKPEALLQETARWPVFLAARQSLVVATVIACSAASAAQVTIGDLTKWTIVVSKDAIPSERYAAEEFRRLMREATGVELPIAAVTPREHDNIAIGPDAASLANVSNEGLGEESLRIRVDEREIVITGGRPRGTLYGVYEFFERAMGVRFLTHDHTHVPKGTGKLRLPWEDYDYTPPFSFRWSYYREMSTQPEFAARLRVNTVTSDEKLGGITPQSLINHSLYRWLPPAKYGKSHPEYFALVHGERKLDIGGGGPEPCVTNRDVIEIVAKAVIAHLDANPGQRNISVSQNDNDDYCTCEKCEAINRAEGTPMGSHLAFVNAVAERVAKKHPDVKIGTLAYWYTRKPPKTIRPHKNLQIQLCSIECCTLHSIDDPSCPKNREFYGDLMAWKEISDDIWIWNYNTNFGNYDLPFPNLRAIGPNVRFFRDNNVHGLFMQANGNGLSGEMSDLRNYVIARTIWNPDRESWDLVEEFCRLHYGQAAETILEYLTMLHDQADARGGHPGCFPTASEVGLDAETALRIMKTFEKALSLAENDIVRERVEKASLCAFKAMLTTCSATKYRDGMCVLNVPDEYSDLIPRYMALARKHHLERVKETQTSEAFFKQIEVWAHGVPAERIENATWRVTLLPTENGKLVEMLHKPSGRDLVFPRGRLFSRHRAMEEWARQGFGELDVFTFDATRDGEALVMTGTLPGGPEITRRVWLEGDEVRFRSVVRHLGDDARTYQMWIHPEFDTATVSGDSDIVAAYVKDGGWRQFNQDWRQDKGPNESLLETAKGGGFAFFNKEAGFGAEMRYDVKEIETPHLWWSPGRSQINLELYSKAVRLKPHASFSYGYRVVYLDQPPK